MTRSGAVIGLLCGMVLSASTSHGDEINFRRDVQPILSDKCFHCHGPDAENQDSEFRADSKDGLFADIGGYFAVVPGDPEKSALHQRIHSDDPDEQMPPPDSNRHLTEQQKQILTDWIKQGAPYQGHWAFERISRPEVPQVVDVDLEVSQRDTANPIDAFVTRRLRQEGLQLSQHADPEILLRRASLTLTGLLPPRDLQDRFLANPSDEAYRTAIDELLNSMAYAERQSLKWLDAARYADTDGYQNDRGRTNWPWRDWVTKAYHNNMPFDQFTIEQLAGDMLPDATDSQKLASAFNRNHRQNAEGGALAEEFLVENVIDRVETTSTVWLGLTMGCARCHDHKYDPLSQREFYQMYAYFNNIGERGIGPGVKANPTMITSSPLIDVPASLMQEVALAEQRLADVRRGVAARREDWLQSVAHDSESQSNTWQPAAVKASSVKGKGQLVPYEGSLKFRGPTSGSITYEVILSAPEKPITGILLTALPDEVFGKPRGLASSVNGNFVMSDFSVFQSRNKIAITKVLATVQQDNYPASNLIDDNQDSGWAVFGKSNQPDPASVFVEFDEPAVLDKPLTVKLKFPNRFANHNAGKVQFHFTHESAGSIALPGAMGTIQGILAKPAAERTEAEQRQLIAHYETIDSELLNATRRLNNAKKRLEAASGPAATVMIMQERAGEPETAYILDRGQYDAALKDEPLRRAVPAALLPSGGSFLSDSSVLRAQTAPQRPRQPKNRLELARWLVSRDNPLTARVTINRMWQDHFGIGLVKTAEDFGVQGEVPSHPDLLDWLASEFMESGWDVKAMHRLIVTSRVYRQSSKTNSELQELDPQNRLLARGPRYRADGFSIRDIALQAAGLLEARPGGPSVKPYQPVGLWANLAANKGTRYTPGKGSDLYRKSMYTYWKRAVNPPRQTIFDAGGREVCNVRVRRTNTPLQALVLMNDPCMIEAARMLAQSALNAHPNSASEQIAFMYRRAIARNIDSSTADVLQNSLSFYQDHFEARPEAAAKLVNIGESPVDDDLPAQNLAALTSVAHLIMNLDEFMTIE